jgi:hypothetical protein
VWKKLPSELLHLGPDANPTDAYSIDQAVWSFGVALDNALQAAEDSKKHDRGKKAARAAVLARWLPTVTVDTPQLRDPGRENPEGMRR